MRLGARPLFAAWAVPPLAACGSLPIVDAPAEIASGRVDHLVFHFTSLGFAESMRLLSERSETPVSVHYLVPESRDPTYPRRRLRV